jgi:CelD/BcsL family acetyltransferase involved in cellulose biosynthesis
MSLITKIHGDEESLLALAPAWRALWRRSRAATPFQAPGWLIAWWLSFAPGRLLAVSAWRDGRLVGLAPLYLESGAWGDRLLPIGMSVSDYLDLLLDPVEAEAAGAALLGRLVDADRSWRSCELEELPPWADGLRLPVPRGCRDSGARQSVCPVLVLPGAVEGLKARFSRSKRDKLRLARSRAARHGGATVESLAADPAGFLPLLLDLHAARWRSRGEPGALASDAVRAFHAKALDGLAVEGLLRLYVLRVGGSVAAAYYGFLHRDRAYAYLTGFDPAFEPVSPGSLLLLHAIREAVREGAAEFHFLRGREPYKYSWGAEDRWNHRRSFARCS